MSIKGTQTEQNLLKAFAGESQARNRYTYFSETAREEGFIQISRIFEETADQEKVHAKRFFAFLEGDPLEITAVYPAGTVGTTLENLTSAIAGEHEEWSQLYPDFAKIAKEEGFNSVATAFRVISVAEKHHEERFQALLKQLRGKSIFRKEDDVVWTCLNCAYIHKGSSAPTKCPACLKPQAYFQVLSENY